MRFRQQLAPLVAAPLCWLAGSGCASRGFEEPSPAAPALAVGPAPAATEHPATERDGAHATHEARASRAMRVVAFAAARIGHRYCWGGTGPDCYDCSGLVEQAWRSVGVHLARGADEIAETLPQVAMTEARPGDVLWWPGHVGIYAGDGWVIDAYDRRHGVVRRRPVHAARRALRVP